MVMLLLLVVLTTAACSLPSNAELEYASRELGSGISDVKKTAVERTQQFAIFASDSLVAEVQFESGKIIRFARIGYNSFGPNAVNVVVAEADGLVPRIASCTDVGYPNFHRDAPLAEHFQPPLLDVKEAVTRSQEVLEEVQFWPRCPMTWDVQDKRGVNYRYCARKKEDTTEPPRPEPCQR